MHFQTLTALVLSLAYLVASTPVTIPADLEIRGKHCEKAFGDCTENCYRLLLPGGQTGCVLGCKLQFDSCKN